MESVNQTTFTEEEAINITIQNGYDGSELNTKAWEQRGCLKPDRTLKGLISKLETIYNSVEVTGSGKKRKYILQGKKDNVTEREFNYKGTLPTEEDLIMQEYIFNQIALHGVNNLTYRSWANYLGFVNVNEFNPEELIRVLKDFHYGFPTIYNPNEVVSTFLQTLNIRNKDVIEKSFKRLHKENRITVTEKYNVQYVDDEYDQINEELYNIIIGKIKLFIESKGVSYYVYTQALTSIYNTQKLKDLLKEVDEFMDDHFGIKKLFKSFHVYPNTRDIVREVSKTEFNEAYYNRLIKLTTDRQKKDDYKDSIYFRKRFYNINTLILLDHIGINVNDELSEANALHVWEKDAFAIDYMAYQWDKRNTFGNN
ncbi:hypothetical protein EVU96_09170 [Bacillus infantis]|uniref:hypothetical protein n=1 Tax=Bacillus infantis TaxID=324767 RepID=UPI00101BF9E3|nr:hypothetical protein [Bacillus infantis]RYI30575.1 hypothetical protein EVU96_09170 [Bacillus infantis]